MSNVSLIGITKPSAITGCATAEELVAYAARVSNPDNQHNHETASRLLSYLMKHAHWSPFEMVHLVMSIETTRDISRQILRHRSFSFQEFSQRYADPTKTLDFELRQARLQDTKNRQNSVETNNKELQEDWNMMQSSLIRDALIAYNWAVNNGIAKEQARAVLPEGNIGTTLYMSGSLRSWIHYVQLRSANGTQKEHQEIAQKCGVIIAQHFPSLAEVLGNGR